MKHILFRLTLLSALFMLTFSNSAFSQTANFRGFVYDKETAEPIIFSNLIFKGTTYGASTDLNGFFSITKIPAGTYNLIVSYVGYDTIINPVTIKDGEIITKKFYLQKKAFTLETFNISAEKQEARTEVQVSVNKITPKEMSQVPSIGGEPDLAQYLQVLPGVIFTGDQGGQLYIRGGSPIQNKVLLDGMIIYNPFHSIGLFSVFDNDIIRSADVYTGGFGAEYSGRISSIMDITTREGNKKRYSGKISSSPFTSKLMIEGPLKKATEGGGGNSSFVISGKTSYLQESSKIFYTYIDTAGLPYNFNDIYGKVSMNADNGSKLNIFGFNFSDNVRYKNVADIDWKSTGFGSNFVLVPGGSTALIDGAFSYSSYDITLQEANLKPRTSSINGFNMGLNFTYFMGQDEVKYGLEVLGFRTNFDFFNSVGRNISQVENTTELGGYIKYKKIIKTKLIIEPSLRLHYYSSLSEFSPEPRLGMKFNMRDNFRLKFAGGLYSQNLISATSDRDVVNLFYGFLSGPDNLQSTFDGKDVTSKLQKARHAIFGFEYDLPNHMSLNVEGYIKQFNQLTNINRDKLYDDIPENNAQPDYLKKDYIIENGVAKGIDVVWKYDNKKVYLWAVYSLGFVDRFDGRRDYVPHFDRRHNVNLVGNYTFGKRLDWEVSARWNLGSGFPFTQTQGFYEFLPFTQGINQNYTTANGNLGIIYGDLNGGQLPWYHRLDISIKKSWAISKNSILEANGSIINAYNRQNIFYFDRVTYKRVDQLPALPSVGVSMTF